MKLQQMPPPVSLSPRPWITGTPKITRSAMRHSSLIGADPVTMNLILSNPSFAFTLLNTSESHSASCSWFARSSDSLYRLPAGKRPLSR